MRLIQSLPSCSYLLNAATAAGASGAAAAVATVQPLTTQVFPHDPQHSFSTSSASCGAWLPAPLNRWLKKQQRGQQNYPTSPLTPGKISPIRHVPPHIPRPHYATAKAATAGGSTAPGLSKQPEIMSGEDSRAAMRAVGQLSAEALALAGSMAVEGTTTDAIDAAVHDFLISRGAYPSPLHYHGFPKSVCTSPNEVVCHGGWVQYQGWVAAMSGVYVRLACVWMHGLQSVCGHSAGCSCNDLSALVKVVLRYPSP